MPENPASKMEMTHPRLPGNKPVATTVGAFESVWAEKGWVKHTPPARGARAAATTPTENTPEPQTPTGEGTDTQATSQKATAAKKTEN